MSKSRNWVFTLNNPTDRFYPEQWIGVKTVLAVLEIGESGTLHYQGYLEWTTPRAISTCKNLLPTAHWEIRRGSRFQAIQYTLKTLNLIQMKDEIVQTLQEAWFNHDNVEVTWSNLPKVIAYGHIGTFEQIVQKEAPSNTQERLQIVQQLIKEGASDADIAESHFDLWCRYNISFTRYRLMNSPPRNFKTKVIVITGPTGTGKSKWCMDNFPEAYWKPRSDWWDGYSGQDTVVLDEFYGWLPFDLLLRLCDRYPLNLQIKGGTINFTAKNIIITSNKPPNQWYKSAYLESFIRRVEEWRLYTSDTQVVTSNYSELHL